MKKKTLAALLALCLALALTACGEPSGAARGSQRAPEAPADDAVPEETQKEENPADVASVDETPVNDAIAEEAPAEEAPAEEAAVEEAPAEDAAAEEMPVDDAFTEVALGETITAHGVDFTFETQGTAKELLPTTPNNGNFWSIGERAGFTLFYVQGTVTNHSDADYNIEWIDCRSSRNGGDLWLDPSFYLDNQSGLTTTAIIAPGETYSFYIVDRLETDWLENHYDSYRLAFQCYESREAITDRLEGGYALSFHQ